MKYVLFFLLTSNIALASERAKTLDFEDALVEGLNKQPLDSLSQISQQDDDDSAHLYKKRAGFEKETRKDLEELYYLQ